MAYQHDLGLWTDKHNLYVEDDYGNLIRLHISSMYWSFYH